MERDVKSLKVLTIGNSFSNNATHFLENIAAGSTSLELTVAWADLGGCSLERHWNLAHLTASEPDFKPYGADRHGLIADGPFNLQDALAAQPWDVITLQQASRKSWRPETYQPYVDNLHKLAGRLAPSAEVMFHQTWSYRADSTFFIDNGLTRESMFEKLRAVYEELAGEYGCRVIPTGQAIQNARRAGDMFAFPDPDYCYHDPTYPQLPRQDGSFNVGWAWNRGTESGMPQLRLDPNHCNDRGRYLGAAVWFETLGGGDVRETTFRPDSIDEDDWRFLQAIAHETVSG